MKKREKDDCQFNFTLISFSSSFVVVVDNECGRKNTRFNHKAAASFEELPSKQFGNAKPWQESQNTGITIELFRKFCVALLFDVL